MKRTPQPDAPNNIPASRRQFLKTTAFGSASALLAASCTTSDPEATETVAESPFFKDTTPFTTHGQTNLEAKIENLGGFITPNDLFFVRNNSRSIDVDADSYVLEVTGDAIDTPLKLAYKDLLNMPSRVVYSYIECGGNQRSFFGATMGQPARGTQWGRGGVGMAIWTGVPLRFILEKAGISGSAVDVQLIGLDFESPEGGFRRPVPVAKAMDEDTILAYRMNGELLPRIMDFPSGRLCRVG